MARSFSGTEQINIAAHASVLITADITIAGWIKRDATGTAYQMWVNKGNGTTQFDWQFYVAGGANVNKLALFSDTGAPAQGVFSTGTITTTTWRHVGVTRISTTVTFYLDGVAAGTGTNTAAFPSNSNGVKLGDELTTTGGNGFDGAMAELQIWNVGLSANEMARVYRSDIVRPDARVLWMPLWGAASPEVDYSGRANNGTLTGTARADHPPILVPWAYTKQSTPYRVPVTATLLPKLMQMDHFTGGLG